MSEQPANRDEFLKRLIDNADPELLNKFGNPLDLEDPRMWLPSTREEKGVSQEDRLRFAELDVESMGLAFGTLLRRVDEMYTWMLKEAENRLIEQAKKDPEGTLRKLLSGDISIPGTPVKRAGSWGPLDDSENTSVRYAGSAIGIKPDQMVDTPDGMIRADEIPGYKDDSEWTPSPDWIDANCMCPSHVARREEAKNNGDDNPFNGTGFYL